LYHYIEMCTFTVPFEARSMEELRFKVMKGKFPALPAVYSSDMQKMVKWLLISEPSQRPDINAVLSHPSTERRAHLAPEPEVGGLYQRFTTRSRRSRDRTLLRRVFRVECNAVDP
jgi:serine/threonine protein kinase